jgi:hypothetical protein
VQPLQQLSFRQRNPTRLGNILRRSTLASKTLGKRKCPVRSRARFTSNGYGRIATHLLLDIAKPVLKAT